jgi:tRNA A-37 threonylcarbamoyl transferase component Bud32/tetratricopeptide (TPR) repeat protein
VADGTQRVAGRFELLTRVGAGAFGEVYRAIDHETSQLVAVKRLHGHLDEPVTVVRFVREAVALSRVRSANVVGYVAHGSDDIDGRSRPWLVTEWIDGIDLGRLRASRKTDRGTILRALRDVLRGASAMHRAGLVHRDLKPSNVFVPSDGGPTKIVDLGVAHIVDGTVLTDAGAILGTPAYMSPEQVRGERVDARSDLWSVGVMLFEAVAGETPFGSVHAVAVLGRVLLDPAPMLASVDPAVPLALDAMVAALLDKDPARRPGDALSVAALLDQVLEDSDSRDWLAGSTRASGPHDDGSASTGSAAVSNPRDERRWVAMLAARIDPARHDTWAKRCMAAGARVELVSGATLAGFGLAKGRGDELVMAARFALEARASGASVALVAGWAEVIRGSAVAGALVDRVASVLDRAGRGEVLAQSDGAERLDEHFELEPVSDGIVRIVDVRQSSIEADDGAVESRLLGRRIAAVGREKELALLAALVSECAQEQTARAALVTGDAGIGKSRLLAELRTRTRSIEPSPRWIVLRGDPMMSDVPHAMLTRGLRSIAALDDARADDASAECTALAWAKSVGFEPTGDLREAFLSLLGVSTDGVDAQERRATPLSETTQRELDALVSMLRAMLARRPLVLAVEDLHWADRATVDALGRVFDECSSAPLALLAVARPELSARYPVLWRGMARTELRLSPLSERACEALVSSAIDIDVDERRALVRRAGGNPLFLEELVRARAAGLVALPAAVQSLLQARLDALGADVRGVAQCASVFGPTFWLEGVAALRGARGVGAALIALERAELVKQRPVSRLAHCTEYAFSHALARDAAYAMLVESDRRSLHSHAADWLGSVRARDPAVLAQHFAAAGRTLEAAEQLRRAAHQALAESAYGDAVEHCTRALEFTATRDESVETLLMRASAYDALGRPEAMRADAEAARDSATDATQSIRARALCAEALFALGSLEEADRSLRAVLEESHASLVGARVQAVVRLAEVSIASGRASEGDAVIDEALSWLEDAGTGFDVLRLRARRVRAQARFAAGDPAGGLAEARHSLHDAEALGHRASIAEGRINLVSMLVRVGRHEEAGRQLELARGEVDAVRAPALRAVLEAVRAAFECETTSINASILACEQAAERARDCGWRRLAEQSIVRAAMHLTLEGARSRDLSPSSPALGGVLAALATAIEAAQLLNNGEVERALDASERAGQALGPRAEMLEGESFVRWVQARCLLRVGRRRDADALLVRAKERLERKASRFRPDERPQFMAATAARRALMALVAERISS